MSRRGAPNPPRSSGFLDQARQRPAPADAKPSFAPADVCSDLQPALVQRPPAVWSPRAKPARGCFHIKNDQPVGRLPQVPFRFTGKIAKLMARRSSQARTIRSSSTPSPRRETRRAAVLAADFNRPRDSCGRLLLCASNPLGRRPFWVASLAGRGTTLASESSTMACRWDWRRSSRSPLSACVSSRSIRAAPSA
jgi:hypothetical protein